MGEGQLPDDDDVVVRKTYGNPSVVYALYVGPSPDQIFIRDREKAIAQARAFAECQRVCAWLIDGDERRQLLADFRTQSES